ncbi:MAG TPA: LysM peptidoglycan-binding domain-containing protein [Anaerolineales bacterium]|nr:LysM peptidoglycan-binding domain-containing protein [Anaerolineales bacterium]
MRNLRDFGNALVVALISIGLIVGALSISLVGFSPEARPSPTNIIPASPLPVTATNTQVPTLIPPQSIESPTPSITPTYINTATPPLSCQPLFGWVTQISIQSGDTLDSLAARYRISKEELRRANCLISDILVAGTKLYIPPVSANTPATCRKGAAGWVNSYLIKAGDTIYAIATSHYTTVTLLKQVNCKTSDLILPGEVIWVPNVATRTPSPTAFPGATDSVHPTEPLTVTVLPFTETVLPYTATFLP